MEGENGLSSHIPQSEQSFIVPLENGKQKWKCTRSQFDNYNL